MEHLIDTKQIFNNKFSIQILLCFGCFQGISKDKEEKGLQEKRNFLILS